MIHNEWFITNREEYLYTKFSWQREKRSKEIVRKIIFLSYHLFFLFSFVAFVSLPYFFFFANKMSHHPSDHDNTTVSITQRPLSLDLESLETRYKINLNARLCRLFDVLIRCSCPLHCSWTGRLSYTSREYTH